RRIEIHAAVSLEALAVCQRTLELPTALEGEGLEVRSQTLEGYQAVNAVSHSFQVADQIPFKNGKPPVDATLRWNAACRVPAARSAARSCAHTVAGDGAGEGCLRRLRACRGECSIQHREDEMGENASASVTGKRAVLALLYQPCEVQRAEDASPRLRPRHLRW